MGVCCAPELYQIGRSFSTTVVDIVLGFNNTSYLYFDKQLIFENVFCWHLASHRQLEVHQLRQNSVSSPSDLVSSCS